MAVVLLNRVLVVIVRHSFLFILSPPFKNLLKICCPEERRALLVVFYRPFPVQFPNSNAFYFRFPHSIVPHRVAEELHSLSVEVVRVRVMDQDICF